MISCTDLKLCPYQAEDNYETLTGDHRSNHSYSRHQPGDASHRRRRGHQRQQCARQQFARPSVVGEHSTAGTAANTTAQTAQDSAAAAQDAQFKAMQDQIDQLQSQIKQYQSREQQYQTEIKSQAQKLAQADQQANTFQQVLAALQDRGLIQITRDGRIFVAGG